MTQGQPLVQVKHALQILTNASKEGWGACLNELTAREPGPFEKQAALASKLLYQLDTAESGLLDPKRVPRPLLRQDNI